MLGGVKLYLARNSFLSLGAGRGLVPDKGGNPGFRAMIGIVFEPNIGDRDGDGIKDDIDKCPDEPEDFVSAHGRGLRDRAARSGCAKLGSRDSRRREPLRSWRGT